MAENISFRPASRLPVSCLLKFHMKTHCYTKAAHVPANRCHTSCTLRQQSNRGPRAPTRLIPCHALPFMTTIQFLAILVWIPCLPEPKHLCHERRAFGGRGAVTGLAMLKAGRWSSSWYPTSVRPLACSL